MTAAPSVSVIMCTGGYKPVHLRNTLYSWSRSTYPVEFILVCTSEENYREVEKITKEFSFITRLVKPPQDDKSEKWARTARAWTREGKNSCGSYVIFAMEDEIIGNYDLVKNMVDLPYPYRVSVRTYMLSQAETCDLETMSWRDDPVSLETYPDFWGHTGVEGADNVPNNYRKEHGAEIYSHITGARREHWEYMGWFRTENKGYFWLDMDMYFRENFVNRPCVTLPEPNCCYHQWHKLLAISSEDRDYEGFIYDTENQARLLEPARRVVGGEYKLPDPL